MVSEVAARLANAQAVIVAEYRGLDVEHVTRLRARARKSGLYLRVLKNTLARRAVQGTPFEKLAEKMVGPLMYGIAADPVAGAKVLSEFARENEQFVIRGGAMRNSVMSDRDVKALALLPSREELLAKLMGTLQAPMARLARTLNEVPGRFVRALAALRDAKSGTYSQERSNGTHANTGRDFEDDGPRAVAAHQGHGAEVRRVGRGCGVGGGAGHRRRGGRRPGGGEDRVHGNAQCRRRQQGERDQGGPRGHEPRPERGQGPG